MAAIAKQVFQWINDDGVRPRDICILANDKYHGQRIVEEFARWLKASFKVGVHGPPCKPHSELKLPTAGLRNAARSSSRSRCGPTTNMTYDTGPRRQE